MVEFCLSDSKQINAALLFLFNNEISVVKCADIRVNKEDLDLLDNKIESVVNLENDFLLSVHPKKSLLKDSPLNDEVMDKELIKAKLPTSMHEYLRSNSLVKKNQSVSKDKPLTFNSKIKSSGYSAVIKRYTIVFLFNTYKIICVF